MAIKRLTIDGFGQIELNNCAFRRDGRIEAQCGVHAVDEATTDATAFNGATSPRYLENGMLVEINDATRKVQLPTATSEMIGLVYSTEHLYDEREVGALKAFALDGKKVAEAKPYMFPRLGYLAVGDKFTTNTICYNDGEYTDDEAVKAIDVSAAPVYGVVDACGAIKVTASKPASGVCLRVVKLFTMPDGQFGIQFRVIVA